MVESPIDFALKDLEFLKGTFFSHIADQVQTLIVELRFLRTIAICSVKWRDISNDGHLIVRMVDDVLAKAGKDLSFARDRQKSASIYKLRDYVVPDSLGKIELCKTRIGKAFTVSFENSSQTDSPMSDEQLVGLLDSILENLKDLLESNSKLIDFLKKKIVALEEKLRFMRNFVAFAAKRCSDHEKRDDLLCHFEVVADAAAQVSCLCWIVKMDKMMYPKRKLKNMFLDLLEKIKPSTVKVIEKYFGVLKASKTSRSDMYMDGEVVVSFVNFLLEDLLNPANDQIETLYEGLVLVLAFIMEPLQEQNENKKLILSQTEAVVSQAAFFVCLFLVEKKKKIMYRTSDGLLHDLLKKIELVKTELKDIYPELWEVPPLTFPRTDGLGFTSFLLENLRKLLKCKADSLAVVKHQIETILGEMEFFRSFLTDSTEQRNKDKRLKKLWTFVTGAAYEVEHVIDSFLSRSRPAWFYILRLDHVIDAFERIKKEVIAIYDHHNHHVAVENVLMTSNSVSLEANTPTTDEVVVGFYDEAEIIRERLTRGPAELDIVAIVGMPGLGKTTLARKVYNESSVTYHFHIRAWCLVSQVYEKRDLLLSILSHVIELTDEIYDMNVDDLDELLYKRLKGKRYLIVMDDVWNTRAWNDLKSSFPNDNNGSRILFTSRVRDVALEAKPDCNPHSLRSFSDEESWELLEKRLFLQEKCPKELLHLGREIAEHCKGLPLSVVVIAGLLSRTEKTWDSWKFVAERLSSMRVGGTTHYMEILDLSYEHLPGHLRPCFLYFGAFPEDEEIPVWKLVSLWVAEGFVHKTELKSLEDIAEGYLLDLVSRSLVNVAKRRSKGGIKTCRVHDVLHDFCVEKAKTDNFLEINWGSNDDANSEAESGIQDDDDDDGGDDNDDDDDDDYDNDSNSDESEIDGPISSDADVDDATSDSDNGDEDDDDDDDDYGNDSNNDKNEIDGPLSSDATAASDNEDESDDDGDDNADHDNHKNNHDKGVIDGTISSVTYKVRRVSIFSKWEHFSASMPFGPRVRSLLLFATGDKVPYSDPTHVAGISDKFKLLKVLDLGFINLGDYFPDEIELLIHLRFLAIRGRMNSIPPSISALWNLETFLVKGLRGEVRLPETIWDMVNLRHLHVNNRVAFNLEETEHVDTCKLENVVSVSTPALVHGKHTRRITRRLVNVRKLKCIFLESWDRAGNCNRFPVLDFLSQLESLKVVYNGMARYPCQFSFPSNLKKLTLSKFCLPWKEISMIGKLPNLEVLKLLFRAFEGQQWDMKDGEFCKLKFLKLDGLNFVQWNASADHFPCLQQLVLQKCKQLEEIPSGFGDIPTLETIEVQWCSTSASNSARQIQEEQKDMGNDGLKVFIYPPDSHLNAN